MLWAAPNGPILGVRVAELHDKKGLIGSDPAVFFTISHLEDYPAVLILLHKSSLEQLGEVLTDAWLCRAPKRLSTAFLEAHPAIT